MKVDQVDSCTVSVALHGNKRVIHIVHCFALGCNFRVNLSIMLESIPQNVEMK